MGIMGAALNNNNPYEDDAHGDANEQSISVSITINEGGEEEEEPAARLWWEGRHDMEPQS